MTLRFIRAASLLALLVFAAPVSASAQDQEAARAAFDEGESHYAASRWMLAAQSFHRAWQLMEGDSRRGLIAFK